MSIGLCDLGNKQITQEVKTLTVFPLKAIQTSLIYIFIFLIKTPRWHSCFPFTWPLHLCLYFSRKYSMTATIWPMLPGDLRSARDDSEIGTIGITIHWEGSWVAWDWQGPPSSLRAVFGSLEEGSASVFAEIVFLFVSFRKFSVFFYFGHFCHN